MDTRNFQTTSFSHRMPILVAPSVAAARPLILVAPPVAAARPLILVAPPVAAARPPVDWRLQLQGPPPCSV